MKKVISLTIIIVVAVFFFISFASNKMSTNQKFQIEEESTWGELYRYYNPKGYENLTEQQQEQLDNILVIDGAPFTWVIKEDDKFVFEFQ